MAQLDFVVGPSDTAVALGSGDVEVLATPRLLAWLEAATVAEAAGLLGTGQTSVGTRVEIEHLAPSSVGTGVVVTAEVAQQDGRLVRFVVAAHDASGRLLATGSVTRVAVDRDRFMDRL